MLCRVAQSGDISKNQNVNLALPEHLSHVIRNQEDNLPESHIKLFKNITPLNTLQKQMYPRKKESGKFLDCRNLSYCATLPLEWYMIGIMRLPHNDLHSSSLVSLMTFVAIRVNN